MWIGASATAIAALGWFAIIPFGVDVPASVKVLALSPDFWPRIIMIMLAGCGLTVLLQGWLARRKVEIDAQPLESAEAGDVSGDDIAYFDTRPQVYRVLGALLGLFVFYFLVPFVGMVVGAIIIVLASTRTLGVKSWITSGALALALPTVLYFFFTQIAYVPIPLGVFEALR
jgi:hypothetical protein